MDSICGDMGKSAWPELVGLPGTVAKETIDQENPLVKAEILLEGTVILAVVICDRVIVWVSKIDGTVVEVPTIG